MRRTTLLAGTVAIVVACGGSAATSTPDNGVDDVLAACQIRAGWTHLSSNECQTCVGSVGLPPCSCDPNRGRCEMQEQAKEQQPDCVPSIGPCVLNCGVDCSCVDACYAGHSACYKLASAFDGCMTDVCSATCK